jgi:hypothetical protein
MVDQAGAALEPTRFFCDNAGDARRQNPMARNDDTTLAIGMFIDIVRAAMTDRPSLSLESRSDFRPVGLDGLLSSNPLYAQIYAHWRRDVKKNTHVIA